MILSCQRASNSYSEHAFHYTISWHVNTVPSVANFNWKCGLISLYYPTDWLSLWGHCRVTRNKIFLALCIILLYHCDHLTMHIIVIYLSVPLLLYFNQLQNFLEITNDYHWRSQDFRRDFYICNHAHLWPSPLINDCRSSLTQVVSKLHINMVIEINEALGSCCVTKTKVPQIKFPHLSIC